KYLGQSTRHHPGGFILQRCRTMLFLHEKPNLPLAGKSYQTPIQKKGYPQSRGDRGSPFFMSGIYFMVSFN
ncbi:hypothetical protein, partial [uncultured Paraglaciecola sp.]|uniref:hypothetical protein n=1 Tax=uncultured Paraglaciecola sp. TaxID=1765024 RepID=UPI0030DCF5DA